MNKVNLHLTLPCSSCLLVYRGLSCSSEKSVGIPGMHVMKNDNVWQTAITHMTVWLRDQFPEEDLLEMQVGRFVASFAENLDRFLTQYPLESTLSRSELALLLVISFLYPEEETVPREQLAQQLFSLAPDGKETVDNACLDLAIAFGCGWRPEGAIVSEIKAGRWHRAIVALRIMVEGSLHQTFKLITPLLPQQYSIFSGSMKEWGRFYSNIITLELANNRCRCGKHKQSCKSKGDAYACGQSCCREEHQISSWSPAVCSLQAFIAHSIRGNAGSQLKTGALITSMLYPLLNEDSGFTIDSVEFKVCGCCSNPTVLEALAQHKEPQSHGSVMYEGNSCPECDTPASRHTTYHKARKNWILIPYEFGGAYEMHDRWRCPRCRNLFPVTLATCPLCSAATPQRKTTIWVYSPWLRHVDGEED